jgi:outer membrane receptor protein involved in Fe transport
MRAPRPPHAALANHAKEKDAMNERFPRLVCATSTSAAVALALACMPARADGPAGAAGAGHAVSAAPLAIAAADSPAAATPAAGPAEPAAADNGAPLDEIVVTAQRRSENLQDVPISISVLSGDELHSKRIADYDDLSRAVPGVSFNSSFASEGLTKVQIRGVSSDSGASTTGIYLDDVSITVNNIFYDGAVQPKLYDLDRLEVLRGPQGTLWGDSSEGGTIRYLTEAPNLHTFSGEGTSDLSNTKHGGWNYIEAGSVNLPISDGIFAVRASVGYTHDSGYIDHFTQSGTLQDKGVNTEGNFSLHVVGKLTPGSDLTITPAIFYQRDITGDNSAFYLSQSLDSTFVPGLWQQDKQVREFGVDTVLLPSLTVTKGLGFADFTSVSGVFVRQHDRQEDGTYYNSTAFAEFFLDPLYPAYTTQNNAIIANLRSPVEFSTHYRTFSQELRLSSLPEDRARTHLQWVAGLYYADLWEHNTNFQQIQGIDQAFQSIYGYSINSPTQSLVYQTYSLPGITQLFPNSIDESDNRTYVQQQYAVFGQADYDVLPMLHATLGARYATSKEDYKSTEIGFYQIGNISPYYQTASYEAFTPKASLGYDISTDSKVYASASKGFRLGGPTGPIVFGPTSVCNSDFEAIGQTTQPTRFGSDSLWSYEFGSKNRLDNNKLSLDAAVFLTQWSNIQQQIYLPTCGYYFTTNVGDAKIYGGEIEASFKPIAGLKFGLTASAEHAVITSTNNPSTVGVGAHLIDVPQGTYDATVAYNRPVNDEYSVTTRADYAWSGHSYGSYQSSNPNFYNPSYGVLNASITLTATKFDVALYAKNLANDQKIIQSPEINTVVEGYTVRPRTIGITGRLWF